MHAPLAGSPAVFDGGPTGADLSLEALFRPRAIAVFGASGRADNPFARPLRYLLDYGYEGSIFPVNPRYGELYGLRCYPSLSDLPEPVDLVLMLTPAEATVAAIPGAAQAGARAVVVFASGFAETGPGGAELQRQLRETAQVHGVRVLGPNCQGVVNTGLSMFGTFTAALEDQTVKTGGVAYVGQSGAVGGAILSLARERGMGIATWASTGNQADLTAVELARFMIEDDATRVTAMYLEASAAPEEFCELAARAAEVGKRLIVLRSGVSAAGARAAASHTGAILGDDATFGVAVEEYGVVEARDVDDLVMLAQAHALLPRVQTARIGVVTTSGGAGSLAADQIEALGMAVSPLGEATTEPLSRVIPAFGAVGNPVDVTAQIFHAGDPSDFVDVCRVVATSDDVDAVMVVLTLVTGELATSFARMFLEAVATSAKPIVLVWLAGHGQTREARAILEAAGCPIYDSARDAARVLSTLVERPRPPRDAPSSVLVAELRAEAAGLPAVVTESDAEGLLAATGLVRPSSSLVRNRAEALELATRATARSVLKIQSVDVPHKSDRGGVVLGVAPGQIADEVERLLGLFAADDPQGVLVQEQVDAGPELIVGVTRDPGGPLLLTVGLGGVATEIFQDTVTAFAPVGAERAAAMMTSLRSAPLLTGFRGQPALDLGPASAAIAAISQLAVALDDGLTALEINPLRLVDGGRRAVVLDFLMIRDLTSATDTHEGGDR